MHYPIVVFAYKRSSSLHVVLQKISQSGTRKLYIFIDGPKSQRDKVGTESVRKEVSQFQQHHPQFEVIVTFRHENIGLKNNIMSGLDTVFRHEQAAIILEDDCLPHTDFFTYCDEILRRYQTDSKIMCVNGTTVAPLQGNLSYTFTHYPQIWGWATWARAWRQYDRHADILRTTRWRFLKERLWKNGLLRWYWQNLAFLTRVGQIQTWDVQWSLTVFAHNGLAVSPAVNLIQNVGFDGQGVNTEMKSPLADLPTGSLSWPLHHPRKITSNRMVDQASERAFYLNWIAVGGMLRQYGYYLWSHYALGH